MNTDLHPLSGSDVVQGTLPLESRKGTLYCLSLFQQRLTFQGILKPVLLDQFLMTSVQFDDRCRPVLTPNESQEFSARVSSISDDVMGMELTVCISGFAQDVRCTLRVVDVPSTDIGGNRQFVLAVHQQVQLPTIDTFSDPLCACLDRPSSLRVSFLCLTSVTPSLQAGGIQGNTLSEARQFCIVLSHQGAGNVLDSMEELALRQFREESGERCFVGIASGDLMPQASAMKGLFSRVRIIAAVDFNPRWYLATKQCHRTSTGCPLGPRRVGPSRDVSRPESSRF